MVEFCATTRAFTAADRDDAERLLRATDKPELAPPPELIIHEAPKHKATAST
jgi:hypothetical protein